MTSQEKTLLRRHYLEQRKNIPARQKPLLDQEIYHHFFRSITIERNAVVAGYYPVNGEVDVLPILAQLSHQGVCCVLPKVVSKNHPMTFARWEENTPMQKGESFPVPEPVGTEDIAPTLLLVPLVAFDEHRHRLGYGGGMYDRTLTHLRETHTLFTLGIGYECQKCEILPHEPTDIPMDMILTEKRVYV